MLTKKQRIKESARRSELKCRHIARIGMMKCDCGNVAFKMSSTGPVCKRCSDLEHRNANGFAKDHAGVGKVGYLDGFVAHTTPAKKRAYKSIY